MHDLNRELYNELCKYNAQWLFLLCFIRNPGFYHSFSYINLPCSAVCKYKDILHNETCYLHCA